MIRLVIKLGYVLGDVVNTDSQIIIIFDFVRTLCGQGGELSSNIYDVLTDLVFHMIVCMQITPVIMSDWNKNHDHFINDDNNIEYKVRYAAYNLLNVSIEPIFVANFTILCQIPWRS